MKTIIGFLITGAIIALASYFLPGVEVSSIWYAVLVGVVIALLSSTIGAFLKTLAMPINMLTLGLVGGLITVGIVMLASAALDGFSVSGFWSAAFFAIAVGIMTSILGVQQEIV